MNTQIRQQATARPTSPSIPRGQNLAQMAQTTTPILAGFYYAVKGDNDEPFSIIQVAQMNNGRLRLCQFAKSFTVLPDYLIPEQLGRPVAQFWLPLDEFACWQPLLMQRGVGQTLPMV